MSVELGGATTPQHTEGFAALNQQARLAAGGVGDGNQIILIGGGIMSAD